ncbi:hypothetical protein DQ244_09805 [Blastococcus sp. TBT05-19]|uniref:nuclear transport factor 2 family protein n=1 Tax=Blastococcus sp. TBT05-19 TaxID=2250581 RepID=UPI000DE911CF|nr:nuclear transport factor 2 family protein [Blastococcus sp. TBT05-19]RBY91597.1 hypothetical protein DQ244_09805 [Blastococcus sp. TBT05-19]
MISDARAHPPEAEDATEPVDGDTAAADHDGAGAEVPAGAEAPAGDEPAAGTPSRRRGRGARKAARDDAGATADGGPGDEDGGDRRGPRLALPLVPALAVLLALLAAAAAFLWFTRPEPSDIRTGDYTAALQAARSGVVDVTSFDHLTIDDDIEQIRRVTVGDLRDEAVEQLDARREEIAASEAVVNTEVVDAGVVAADGDSATVALLIQSTQQSNASPQAQIVKYRIQVELQKVDDQWRLSGITGR